MPSKPTRIDLTRHKTGTRCQRLFSLLTDCIYAIIIFVNIVVDTDVWVAGVRGSGHANRVLRLCLEGRFIPLMGAALLAEYEDLLGRESIWCACWQSKTDHPAMASTRRSNFTQNKSIT